MVRLDVPSLGPLMVDATGPQLSAEDRERMTHPLVGGVILFTRNYVDRAQLRELTGQIRALRTPELLIAVDQEGGRVQRFRNAFSPLPPAASFGKQYEIDPDTAIAAAQAAGWVMASELKSVGIDFSFAPVLDVAHTPSDVIGDRAFHSTPEIVSRLGRAWIEGMHAAGMAATGKHFPGHGGVSLDSHSCLPCDERDLEQIATLDLLPFVRLAPILGGMMTAHILFQAVDDTVPTYSPRWLKEILRGQMGFTGVIFSDDLSMQGAATELNMEHRVTRALAAGCDMVLICNDPRATDRVLDQLGGRRSAAPPSRLAAMRGGAIPSQLTIEPAAAHKKVAQLTEIYG